MEKNKFIVYKIDINGKTRYIGRTSNLKRRQSEHGRLLKRGNEKQLYVQMRKCGATEIQLDEIATFKSRVEAKRFECLHILLDHFDKKELWQKPPNISDMWKTCENF